MRDIDDRHAFGLEVGDDAEQDLDFRRAQRRSRLVHDQDARVARHRLGDLDQLLLADHQVVDHRARIDAGLQPLHQRRGLPFLLAVIDVAMAHDFAAGEDVLRHREVAEQVQFLEHHADAVRHRIGGVEEDDWLAVEQDAPGSRAFDAGDHLHQRRFAGAVLADQHVDRPASYDEIGALDRDGAGIDLGHALEAEDDVSVVLSDGVGHGLGPIVISTGVTCGGSPEPSA